MPVEREWGEVYSSTEIAWKDLIVVRNMLVIMHAILKDSFGLKTTDFLDTNILDANQFLLRNLDLAGYCLGDLLIEQRLLTLTINKSSLARLLENKVEEVLDSILKLPFAVWTVGAVQRLDNSECWVFHIWYSCQQGGSCS